MAACKTSNCTVAGIVNLYEAANVSQMAGGPEAELSVMVP